MRDFTYLRMSESQVGVGDKAYIGRIMSRLTMAKILEKMGHDVDEIEITKEHKDPFCYYSSSEVFDDICEFLELAGAKFDADEENYEITLYFPPETKNVDSLVEDFFFYFNEYGEYEYEENSSEIILRFYVGEGYPLNFFISYYELVKENDL